MKIVVLGASGTIGKEFVFPYCYISGKMVNQICYRTW